PIPAAVPARPGDRSGRPAAPGMRQPAVHTLLIQAAPQSDHRMCWGNLRAGAGSAHSDRHGCGPGAASKLYCDWACGRGRRAIVVPPQGAQAGRPIAVQRCHGHRNQMRGRGSVFHWADPRVPEAAAAVCRMVGQHVGQHRALRRVV
ncbi:hypothetical protein EC988_007743, partial [Linderina pennispora]